MTTTQTSIIKLNASTAKTAALFGFGRLPSTFDVSHLLPYTDAKEVARRLRTSYRFARKTGATEIHARYLVYTTANNLLRIV